MRGGRLFTVILFCLMLIFSRADIMFGDPPGDPGNLDALVGDIDEGPPEIFEYRGNGSPLKVKIIQNGASLEVEDYDSAIIRTTLESGEFPITVIYDKDLVDSNWQSPFGPSFVHDPGSLCGT